MTQSKQTGRRAFLSRLSALAMATGLVASYGTFAAFAGRFLYPARPRKSRWLFVHDVGSMSVGEGLLYHTPGGSPVTIARRGESGTTDDFIALSSTCPHLGCRVHWEQQNNRFFCPCHSGVFDPSGRATSGPPADAGQRLPRYELKIANGLLFIRVELA